MARATEAGVLVLYGTKAVGSRPSPQDMWSDSCGPRGLLNLIANRADDGEKPYTWPWASHVAGSTAVAGAPPA